MIDQYKYTWKMVKPLIPIIFLAIWVVLFEEKFGQIGKMRYQLKPLEEAKYNGNMI